MAKKKQRSSQTTEEHIEEVLSRVDPLHAAVMVLGGTAAAYGIVPPMTALFMAFSGKDTGPVGTIWHFFTTPMFQQLEEWRKTLWSQGADQSKPPGAQGAEIAAFCSGAVEAAIMYQLVSNPETLKTLLAIPGQAMQGIGKLASFIPK